MPVSLQTPTQSTIQTPPRMPPRRRSDETHLSESHLHHDHSGFLDLARTITRWRMPHTKTLPTNLQHDNVHQHDRGRSWWNIFPFHFASSTEDHSATREMITEAPEPIKKRYVGPVRGQIQPLLYNSVDDLRRMQATSDHRPVRASFAIGASSIDYDTS